MTRPNILFLFSDEHSFRFMGHRPAEMGGEPAHTPHFDRLASQGTVFTDAYCQMALCTPSRLCLLTGREVRNAGAWDNNSVLRPEIPTMAQVLGENGYATCLMGKMHLGGNQQFAGFQHRPYGDLTGKTGHQWEPLDDMAVAKSIRGRTQRAGVSQIPESLHQEQVIAQEVLAFLRNHQAQQPDQPWFMLASFSRPHFPLTAPQRHLDRYWPDGVTPPKVGATGDAYDHPMAAGARAGFGTDAIESDEMLHARASYFACVTYLDEIIGDLLLRMEVSGLLDNTIIVYTADHGEMVGEHGLWWKHTWHEASTHVPYMISLPEQRQGKVAAQTCSTPVALIDLFPTFCGFAGVTPPAGLDGADLSGAVTDPAIAPERPIFSDNLVPRWGAGTEYRMIRWRQFKYVTFRDGPSLCFDLQIDPGEQVNLIGRERDPTTAEALRYLEQLALETMDFEAAEQERTQRDGPLSAQYALNVPASTPNLYHMPAGQWVNADDALYNPTVISDNPAQDAGDFPV